MAGDFDLTNFLKEGSGSGVTDLDWLDVDEEAYRQMDQLPKQNLEIAPDLQALWGHEDESSSKFIPNTGGPQTMGDMSQRHGPLRASPEDIIRTARLAMMQSPDPKSITSALQARYDQTSLVAAKTALATLMAERGLLGRYYIDATDFPDCAQGTKSAKFVRRFAKGTMVKAKDACASCQHRRVEADGTERCSVFHKQIVVDVPYTEEIAKAVEDSYERAKGEKVASNPNWKGVAKKLLDQNKGKTQDDFHYRAYLREVIEGRDPGHLAKKYKGAQKAREDLVDEGGKAASAKERIRWAFLNERAHQQRPQFSGRRQAKPKAAKVDPKTAEKVKQAKLNREAAEQAKIAAQKARPVIALLRREMLKGRSPEDLKQALRLAFDPRDLKATAKHWLPLLKQAGLFGVVYTTQDSFADCREGADFLNKHGSRVRAIVAGSKCESCIFSKVGRCMMYGRKLVQASSDVLTPETVRAVLDEQKLAGNLPVGAERIDWGQDPGEALKAIHNVATSPKVPVAELRANVEAAFRGQFQPHVSTELTKRSIVKATQQYLNEGLYGDDLLTLLRGKFEVRDLVAAKDELRKVLAEQGLQGIKYVDPTVYDDYGKGCKTAAAKHRSRTGVKFAKVGSKCGSCVYQTQPGRCSVLNKQLVVEPPYVDKVAEQKAILASGRATEVSEGSLVNNGLTMMQEYELQHQEDFELNPTAPQIDAVVQFGDQEVKL